MKIRFLILILFISNLGLFADSINLCSEKSTYSKLELKNTYSKNQEVIGKKLILNLKQNRELNLEDKDLIFYNLLNSKKLNKNKVLFSLKSSTLIENYILDLNTFEVNYLTDGLITSCNNKTFTVFNKKDYLYKNGVSFGAFWVDLIIDYNGNVLKFLSKEETKNTKKLKIKSIINPSEKYPYLEQSFEEYINVER